MLCLFLLLSCVYQSRGQAMQKEVVAGIGIKLCNQKCVERGSCMSFAYAIDRLSCHLLYNDSVKRTTKDGYVVHPKLRSQLSACSMAKCGFNTRCVERRRGGAACVKGYTDGSSLESRCKMNSDCPGSMFVCFTMTCKCVPGYSFNPANNNCVRQCKVYGDGLTRYQGLGLKGYNDRAENTQNLKECSNMCIREKRFTCLTFEYLPKRGTCQISKFGYLDVEYSRRETGQEGWIFAVRNCE
ncbi:uncharacterized protein [Haliotis asinina]|uniref:uncharacterized protein n=1 Tax=Haliotis asinina TaxID=109174 RepID=UPI003531E06E